MFFRCLRFVNVTVDDTNPDPFTGAVFDYSPSGWSFGPSCDVCKAKPDQTKTYDGTWHDATYDPTFDPSEPGKSVVQTASLQYNGSAFYVYGILSESTSDPGSIANIVFLIDGQPIGKFVYTPPGITGGYIFNVLLYGNDTIPQGQHTFTIQNGEPGGSPSESLILLDYIIYTRLEDDPVVTSSGSVTSQLESFPQSPQPVSALPSSALPSSTLPPSISHGISHETRDIVVSCIASAVGTALLVLLLFYCLRRRSRSKKAPSSTAVAYPRLITKAGTEGGIGVHRAVEWKSTPTVSLRPLEPNRRRSADGTSRDSSFDTSRKTYGAATDGSPKASYYTSSKVTDASTNQVMGADESEIEGDSEDYAQVHHYHYG
ncbi:hypothetical protein EW026_g2910 [Hermanssonia centrifuga]|uniref:Uncharacterized protein n=1 Tax=Hermanssonia centrifuga TaxID=98765 RepID=A0A4S4KMD2_9APHY|nr:hypothetical protein EW026_g2910 [Hermanssonia centrifuga]